MAKTLDASEGWQVKLEISTLAKQCLKVMGNSLPYPRNTIINFFLIL